MAFDQNHDLFVNFRESVKRLYGITSNKKIAEWVKGHVSKYTVGEILQILKYENLEDNIIYKACFAEILVRQGKAKIWNIAVQNNRLFIMDIWPHRGKHTTIQFLVK